MPDSQLAAALAELDQLLHAPSRHLIGRFEKRVPSSGLSTVAGLTLSAELAFFYQQYAADLIVSYANIAFTPLENLARRQAGFASFSKDAGKTWQQDPTWPAGWVVFADVNDDPIVADTISAGTPIYAGIEGVAYQAIAPSLAVFFQLVNEMLKTEDHYEQARADRSQDSEAWILFKETTLIPRFLDQAASLLDSQHLAALDAFLHS
jgi:hypothetical protein